MTTVLGAAHVAGTYPNVVEPPGFLAYGLQKITEIGCRAVKLWMTPNYATDYSHTETWPPGIANLTDLASTANFQNVLSSADYDVYFLVAYTFANGVNDPWRNGVTPTMLTNEKNEIQNLAAYLLTTYAGTNKKFIIQQWEGDWALLGNTNPATIVPQRRIEFMASFLRARQEGVTAARLADPRSDVFVYNAVEVNRVVDVMRGPGTTRVTNRVLPLIDVDMISYSAYDSTTLDYGSSEAEMLASIDRLFPRAIRTIRSFAKPGTPVYVGEFGFAENELPVGYNVDTLIRRVHSIGVAEDLTHMVYWQIFDNECVGAGIGCRGFWLVKPDLSLSGAGVTWQDLAT